MSAHTIPLTADEAINQFFLCEPQKCDTVNLNDDLVYVLHLVDGKFYVGRSKQFRRRIDAHFCRKSAWTRKYPPIAVLDLIQPVEDFDEDKITLRYMNQFGVDNVRGGSFSSIDLDPSDVTVIGRMCTHARGGCFLCGNKGHYARACTVKRFEEYSTSRDSRTYRVVKDALRRRRREYKGLVRSKERHYQRRTTINFDDSDADYDSDDLYDFFFFGDDSDDDSSDDNWFVRPSKRRRHIECSRCGHDGHTKRECYARFDTRGREIKSRSSTRRGPSAKAGLSPRCRRCGRDSHTRSECYASTHVSGRYL